MRNLAYLPLFCQLKLAVYSVIRRRVTKAWSACTFVKLIFTFVFHNENVLYDMIHIEPVS